MGFGDGANVEVSRGYASGGIRGSSATRNAAGELSGLGDESAFRGSMGAMKLRVTRSSMSAAGRQSNVRGSEYAGPVAAPFPALQGG